MFRSRRPAPEPAVESSARWVDALLRRTMVAQLTDDSSIGGVLVESYDDAIVLENPFVLEGKTRTTIDGRAVVPRAKIAWLQELPPPAVETIA
jgi:hypothetical protein